MTSKEEAEFWDIHSPLDFGEPSDIRPLIVSKDRSLSIRLDGRTYQQLQSLARSKEVNISTAIRLILISFLRRQR